MYCSANRGLLSGIVHTHNTSLVYTMHCLFCMYTNTHYPPTPFIHPHLSRSLSLSLSLSHTHTHTHTHTLTKKDTSLSSLSHTHISYTQTVSLTHTYIHTSPPPSLSLSLSHTHTHTHTHSLLLTSGLTDLSADDRGSSYPPTPSSKPSAVSYVWSSGGGEIPVRETPCPPCGSGMGGR